MNVDEVHKQVARLFYENEDHITGEDPHGEFDEIFFHEVVW